MTDYSDLKEKAPHVPAAFINAIWEEGTKDEACKYLQEQWNERCQLRSQLAAARAEIEETDKENETLMQRLEIARAERDTAFANGEAKGREEAAKIASHRASVFRNADGDCAFSLQEECEDIAAAIRSLL